MRIDRTKLIHTNYIKYFHETNRKELKDEVILNVDTLFQDFEQNFGELS